MNAQNTAALAAGALADPGGRAPTRSSFVVRLKDWGDQSIWEGFFQRYGRLVRQAAVRSGLSVEEAEDVVQETALSVARKMPEFVFKLPAVTQGVGYALVALGGMRRRTVVRRSAGRSWLEGAWVIRALRRRCSSGSSEMALTTRVGMSRSSGEA